MDSETSQPTDSRRSTGRTSLLDFFRRGEAAKDVRLLAARGAVALGAHEQVALLILLVEDADPDVAAAADATIAAIPRASVEGFLARPDVSVETRNFFAARGVGPGEPAAVVAHDPSVDIDRLFPGVAQEPAGELADPGESPDGEVRGTMVQKIAGLNIPERVALAMKGSREERGVLIRDANKIVAAAVLSSPRLTESEVEAFARMASVSEDVLRTIGHSRAWTKNYGVVHALVRNPKTPVAMAMNFLPRLVDKDLRALSTNRNVAEVLRISARRKVVVDR
jgi:hypothetical protein